ncbi:acyltransferase [Actinopolymorpha sp. NPDC004070]|uniref:acyltransferase family protein n=1 Tax=Actinopolymorpha sp. NPDC004070 TaxID=3154548 RepID=UPI0033A2CF5D
MARLRELADRTPASRERYVDLLRALAITAVVLGHWLLSAITYDAHGRLTGRSALDSMTWAYPLTWVAQVMPIFFVVGGYANAASLQTHRRKGENATDWLLGRTGRLVGPTTGLLVTLAAVGLVANVAGVRLLGLSPGLVRFGVWVASIPLWFLTAYLLVVLLAPVMYRLHRRFGIRVVLVLVLLVAVGDVARLEASEWVAAGNFLFGWLAIHQLGFFWRDGQLPDTPRVWIPLLVGGLGALALLTLVGPYAISMIDVTGQQPHNASPPTLALLAAATMQFGIVLMLRVPAERWLHRPNPWLAVVAVNSVVLTIFLWHMSAVVLLVGVLAAADLLPTPAVVTTSWWLWRLPWLLMLSASLALLVAVFGRLETRARPRPTEVPRGLPNGVVRTVNRPAPRLVLAVGAYLAVMLGLLANSLAPSTGSYLLGMPAGGFLCYLLGAGILRLLRSIPRPVAAGERGNDRPEQSPR